MSTDNGPYSNPENFKFVGLFYHNDNDERTFIKIPGTANRYRLD